MKDGKLFSEAWAFLKKTVGPLLNSDVIGACVRSSVHVWLYLLCGEVAWVGVVGSVETRRGCET